MCRYSDFHVNEIGLDDKVIHLTSLEPPPIPTMLSLTVDQILTEYSVVVSDHKEVERLKAFLHAAASGPAPEPLTLGPFEEKGHRGTVHKLFKKVQGISQLETETVEGSCIRVSVYNKSDRKRMFRSINEEWPGGNKRYVRFALYKENTDIHVAVASIANTLKLNHKVFQMAGTKDKRGVTVQAVTAFRVTPARLAGLNKSNNKSIRVGNFEFVDEQLRLGDLKGNRFDILLRNVQPGAENVLEAVKALANTGFINYFGLQRFGTGMVATHVVGKALLQGKWEEAIRLLLTVNDTSKELSHAVSLYLEKGDASAALAALPPGGKNHVFRTLFGKLSVQGDKDKVAALTALPRNLRSLYIHAYQSYLFNIAASERVKRYGIDKVIPGDLVLPQHMIDALENGQQDEAEADTHGVKRRMTSTALMSYVHVVTEEEALEGKYAVEDVVLPTPGGRTLFPANDIAQVYTEAAKEDGISLDTCYHSVKEFSLLDISGGYRRLLYKPKVLDWQIIRYENPDGDILLSDLQKLEKKTGDVEVSEGKYLGLRLTFELPSAMYATMLIRELTKMETSKIVHAGMGHD